jgi:3-hydroxyisobutyrate dehydrogenase
MPTIAFLGMGAMGSRMARRLLENGRTLTVWNRSPAPIAALTQLGAVAAASPRQAAEGADIVVSMVADDAAARAVWLDPRSGAAQGLRAGSIAVESSTVTPGWIAELGAAVEARGAALVDAPVAGSLPAAAAGQLLVLMGGDDAAVDKVKAALAPLAAAFRHLGPSGRGARFKLTLNHLLGAQIALMAEALAGLAADGFDEKAAAEALAGAPVVSPAAANYGRLMAAGQHDKLFGVDLMAKDLRYALQVGAAKGVKAPIAEAALGVFERASQSGLGDSNASSVRKLYP